MRRITVASSLVADLLGYLRARGIDADALWRRAGGEGAVDATPRVSAHLIASLWAHAIDVSGDPDLGLHTGFAFLPGALDIVGYVMLSSRTADEALRRGARLVRLLNDGLALDVTHDAGTTTCRLRMLSAETTSVFADARPLIETVLGGAVYQLRLLTERPVIPLAVRFRHARPSTGMDEHTRLFGIVPTFGADEDAVVLHRRDLDVPLRSANAPLLLAFEMHAEATLAALDVQETLSARTLHEIVAQLKGEAPTIVMVAKSLAMSPRHLQRGLAHEGTTFQTLLDDARRELAVRHLAASNATVAKVAWLVGFSEPSAFHRAFRRWTGRSPRAATVGDAAITA